MTFPEVEQWAKNVVLLIQIIGGAAALICLAVAALMIAASFGNEQKIAEARIAGACAIVGIFLLAVVFRANDVIKALTSFIGH